MLKEKNTLIQAWIFSMSSLMAGAIALMSRWMQLQVVYEEETGLPQLGRWPSTVLMLVMVLLPIALWLLAGKMPVSGSSEEPEEALAAPNKEIPIITIVLAVVAGVGSILMFFKAGTRFEYIVALLGLLAAPALATYYSLPKWGKFGVFLAVLPVLFFALWLVAFYKTNAKDPVVWNYGPQIMAIVGCLYGSFRLCGYLFYRLDVRKTVFGCGIGLTYSLMILTDGCSVAMRAVLAAWGIFLGITSWVLVKNLQPEETEEEPIY